MELVNKLDLLVREGRKISDAGGESSFYCEINLGKKSWKTEPGEGTCPKWNTRIEIENFKEKKGLILKITCFTQKKKKKIGHAEIPFEEIKTQFHGQDWYFLFRKKVIVPGAAIFVRWDYSRAEPSLESSPPSKKKSKNKPKSKKGTSSTSEYDSEASSCDSRSSSECSSRTPSAQDSRIESRTPSNIESRTPSSYVSRTPSVYSGGSPPERISPRENFSNSSNLRTPSTRSDIGSVKSSRSRSSKKSSGSKHDLQEYLPTPSKEQLRLAAKQKKDEENVEKIGEIVSSLKQIVTAQAREIELQKQTIKKITDKLEDSQDSIQKTNRNYQKILRRW